MDAHDLGKDPVGMTSSSRDDAILRVLLDISGSLKRLEARLAPSTNPQPPEADTQESNSIANEKSQSDGVNEEQIENEGTEEAEDMEQGEHCASETRPETRYYLLSEDDVDKTTQKLLTYTPHSDLRNGTFIAAHFPPATSQPGWSYYKPVWPHPLEALSHKLICRAKGNGKSNFIGAWESNVTVDLWEHPYQDQVELWLAVPYFVTPPSDIRLLLSSPNYPYIITKLEHDTLTELLGGLWTIPPDWRLDLNFQQHMLRKQKYSLVENAKRFREPLLELYSLGGSFEITDIAGGTVAGTIECFRTPDLSGVIDDEWWTILVLAPKNARLGNSACGGYQHEERTNLWVTMLYHIHYFIETASQSWMEIKEIFEELLAGSFAEEMLAEDDKFSLSQKLFWIINKIDYILPMITDAVVQWDRYMDAHNLRINHLDLCKAGTIKLFEEKVAEIKVLIHRLQISQEDFEAMRDRARSLRDGLFALTSVKEARESRLLGENVKLLTYVTIFYLPLAFCTSMWAINDMFGTGTRGFAIITTIIAVGTYAVVLSINFLSQTSLSVSKLAALAQALITLGSVNSPVQPEQLTRAIRAP
ncbi:hypothetical protein N431DRAFT_471572 [Stipitochalara longipes BDJ]|nr:hypothetical protein N431DRAFT_471572 [Stipitochalara longipes BDJ]